MSTTTFLQELSDTLSQLRESKLLCDTVLSINSNSSMSELWAHSVILAATSNQLCQQLVLSRAAGNLSHHIQLPECDPLALEAVIRYLYTGRLVTKSECQKLSLNFDKVSTVLEILDIPVAKLGSAVSPDDTAMKLTEDVIQSENLSENISCKSVGCVSRDDHLHIEMLRSSCQNDTSDKNELDNCLLDFSCLEGLANDRYASVSATVQAGESCSQLDQVRDDNCGKLFISEKVDARRRSGCHRADCQHTDVKKLCSKKSENTVTSSAMIRDHEPFVCSFCGIKVTTAERLYAHCKQCPRRAAGRRRIRIQGLRTKKKNWKPADDERVNLACAHCGEQFISEKLMRHHQFTKHTTDRPHVCDCCGKAYRFRSSLAQHVVSVHHQSVGRVDDGAAGRFLCDLCGRSFAVLAALHRHAQRIHLDYRPHVCTVADCQKRCSTAQQLRDHVAAHHPSGGNDKAYRCPTCNRGFTVRCNMLRHARMHTNGEQYTCTVCDRLFRHRQNLVVHQRNFHSLASGLERLSKRQGHQCSVCGKVCRTKTKLEKHFLTHSVVVTEASETTELDKNVCQTCGKRFSELRYLAVHSVVHKEKHECSYCMKKFTYLAHCRTHMLRKHGAPATETAQASAHHLATSSAVETLSF